MPTAREYFDKDARDLRYSAGAAVAGPDGSRLGEVLCEFVYDVDAGVRYRRVFIDQEFDDLAGILQSVILEIDWATLLGGVQASMGNPLLGERMANLHDLPMSNRAIVYTSASVARETLDQIEDYLRAAGANVSIRDGNYVRARSATEHPLAFISHDSRDKDPFVRGLANTLQQMFCPVWYDEYSLVPGASLRESIERGIRDCKVCVLVLSPNFLTNQGWTRAEFDSIYSREIHRAERVMIPIWLGVDREQLYQYSPILVDRVGIDGRLPVEEIARKVLSALNPP